MTSPAAGSTVAALRADGRVVGLRPVGPDDRAALLALYDRSSDRSIYRRYFTTSRTSAASDVDRLARPADDDHEVIAAEVDGVLAGVGSYERTGPGRAEIAVLVDDGDQHRGIGTLLIEHLAGAARRHGIDVFEADVLAENAPMLRVFRDLGFTSTEHPDAEVVHVVLDLGASDRLVSALGERERAADAASLAPLLAPRSVAVVGAGARAGSVGRQVLANIVGGGFTGVVRAVNPHHHTVLGVRCFPTVDDLPEAPDLVVVAVPVAAVAAVVEACGRRGARGIVLMTAGFSEVGPEGREAQRDAVALARRFGMRLIGPNCLGLLNTAPDVRLNATFADLPMDPGPVGLVSQSGALGIAVLDAAQRRGLGVSQFVSVGNKADVSGNDLLMAWERDDRVGVVALYLESFGNPRKFARIARRVAARKPVVAIKAGRSAAGERAGRSHTAAAATSDAVVDAMFTQAGVLRVDGMERLLDVAHLLGTQPPPAGPRVAVIGNSGGPEILAVDAATAAGLTVVDLSPVTTAVLHTVVPTAASCTNPVDLGATVAAAGFGRAVEAVLDDPAVDAVIVVYTVTSTTDPVAIMAAVAAVAGASAKPVAVVDVGGAPRSLPPAHGGRPVPIYGFPESAAAAMGLAARYGAVRATPVSEPARPADVDAAAARAVVDGRQGHAGWLRPDEVARVLTAYGLDVVPQRLVTEVDDALAAASALGYPLAVKVADGAVHKTDVGGVRLGVADPAALREAFHAVLAAVPDATSVLLQPMAAAGVELIVGAVQDPAFGPVVMLGAGGTLADVLADRVLRLAPVAPHDVEEMIAGLRTAVLLDGYRGGPVVSHDAVADAVVRVATLADDLPEIAELDLNPVIARGDRLVVVDARIRVAPPVPLPDPLLRALRVTP